jgi:hypothetical protein
MGNGSLSTDRPFSTGALPLATRKLRVVTEGCNNFPDGSFDFLDSLLRKKFSRQIVIHELNRTFLWVQANHFVSKKV